MPPTTPRQLGGPTSPTSSRSRALPLFTGLILIAAALHQMIQSAQFLNYVASTATIDVVELASGVDSSAVAVQHDTEQLIVSSNNNNAITETNVVTITNAPTKKVTMSPSTAITNAPTNNQNPTYQVTITNAPNTTLKIPRNLIFNSKSGIPNLPDTIQSNINHTISLFPGWNIISDDDAGCISKLQQVDLFADNITMVLNWYSTVAGMYKSDLCRLAQLYIHGGLYVDNDLELIHTLIDVLDGVTVLSSLVYSEFALFQAVLAAPAGHTFLRNSLERFKVHMESGAGTNFNIGPRFMMATMREQYNITGRINRQTLLKEHGVYLLKEAMLDSNHTMMRHRTEEGACNVAIEGIPDTDVVDLGEVNFRHDLNSTIYGFSRVIKGRSNGVPCSEKPFVYD